MDCFLSHISLTSLDVHCSDFSYVRRPVVHPTLSRAFPAQHHESRFNKSTQATFDQDQQRIYGSYGAIRLPHSIVQPNSILLH